MKFEDLMLENFTAEMHQYIDKKMLTRIGRFLANKGVSIESMRWSLTPFGRGTFVRSHSLNLNKYTLDNDVYSIGIFKISKSVENYQNKIILIITSPDEEPILRMVTYHEDTDDFSFNRIDPENKTIFTTKIGFTSPLTREEYQKLKGMKSERASYKKPTPFEKQIASYKKKVDAYMSKKGMPDYD